MRFASCAACLKGIRLALVGLLATVSELDRLDRYDVQQPLHLRARRRSVKGAVHAHCCRLANAAMAANIALMSRTSIRQSDLKAFRFSPQLLLMMLFRR